MAGPSVYAYIDYRAFLRDWIAHAKREDPRYSYAAFAAAGGCSKSALANVLDGARHPRPATLDAFARAMGLRPAERNFLGLLVDLDAAPNVSHRAAAMERLLASTHHHQVRVAEADPPEDVMRYFEHWYVPAIRELATLPGFEADATRIAATLRPPIRPEEAQQALDTLFDLGLLQRRDDGTVEAPEIRFRTKPETAQRAAFHVHTQVIPALLRALDTRQAHRQHLLAATLTLSEDQIPEVKARLNAVVEQIANQADEPSARGPKAVYQLAIQLLPTSEPVS